MLGKLPMLSLLGTALFGFALAEKHYLINGFTDGSNITVLEFDDETRSLAIVQSISIPGSGSRWIALDAQQENLYVAGEDSLRSFSVSSNLTFVYNESVNVSTDTQCASPNYVAASMVSPYPVFTSLWSAGCPSYGVSVDDTGSLATTFANLTYDSSANIHGVAISPDGAHVYSADDPGNAVWAHSYDSSTGTVTEIQKLVAPQGSNPRHLTVHPNGRWVYVIHEETNEIGVYGRDNVTGELTYTNTSWPLLPSSFTNGSSYWSDEVMLSRPPQSGSETSPKYLVAGTRSRDTSLPGYASVFALDMDTGEITERQVNSPTTGSGGGIANAVSTAKFSEEYFGLTDSNGFVAIYLINGTTASAVAQVSFDLSPGNLIWW